MLRASYHQGHSRFRANGRQCMANSLQCMITAQRLPPSKWTPTVCGFQVQLEEPLHGTLCRNVTEKPFFTLDEAFDKLTNVNADNPMFIFTMGSGMPAYTCCILKEKETLGFFDPHSRDNTGLAAPDGHACVTFHHDTDMLCHFIRKLASSLQMVVNIPFEIAQVHFSEDSSDSEFSGFSLESEGSVTCRLFMGEEAVNNMDVSDVSDVSSVEIATDSGSELSLDSSFMQEATQNLNDTSLFLHGMNVNLFSDVESDDDIPLIKLKEKCQAEECEENIPLIQLKKKQLGSSSCSVETSIPVSQSESPPPIQVSPLVIPPSMVTDNQDNQESRNNGACESPISNTRTETDKQVDVESDETCIYQQRGRKRKRDVSEWKRNITKKRYNEGKSYVDRYGIFRAARKMKPGCGQKCRYKCQEKINEEDREKLFHSFWSLGSKEKRRHFLLHNIKKKPKGKCSKSESRRQNSISWYLPKPESEPVQVCKTFFLHTLAMSDKVVSTVHKKAGVVGIADDLRGKHDNRPNKISSDERQKVSDHINLFETVESHYCRKDSKKGYLPSEPSVAKMHHLYCKQCENDGTCPVKLSVYRDIFNNEFNLAFHKPLKDQCDICTSYKNSNDEGKENMKDKYHKHIRNKDMARMNKLFDKTRATGGKEPDLHVGVFDLEEVLLTPNAFTSSMYYKRRLNTYNLTIYDLGSRDGHCYIWHESIASRGGSEIASCVFSYIKTMCKKGKKEFIFFSDNCTAQNKSRQYLTMLWYCLQKYNLKSITHKYLEKGHTMSEGDSIHSSIERASHDKPMYSTPEWAATIRMARINQPYLVKEMGLRDFFDFKILSSNINIFEIIAENNKLYWNSIKVLRLTSDSPNQFEYKMDYQGETHTVNLFHRLRSKEVPDPKTLFFTQLRSQYIEIPWLKYVDLTYMCREHYIPSMHHAFYLLLPHEKPPV